MAQSDYRKMQGLTRGHLGRGALRLMDRMDVSTQETDPSWVVSGDSWRPRDQVPGSRRLP